MQAQSYNETLRPLNRVVSAKEAAYILGVSLSTLWRLARTDHGFPDQVAVSERRIGWMESELILYAESKKAVDDVIH